MPANKVARLAVVATVILSGALARSEVNLEWRPAMQVVEVGDTVRVGLYATSSDGETTQQISAMDVLLQWDATALELIGVIDNGPYGWLPMSGFPDDSALDGLNNTWEDGDAKYTALAQQGAPAEAPPEGLLVTTFEFSALQETPANELNVPAELGLYSRTVVYGTAFPGQEITGILGSSLMIICAGPADGDTNGDGITDGNDIAGFVDALLTASPDSLALCPADFDRNGIVGSEDVAQMLAALLTP